MTAADVRVGADRLRYQAQVARGAGNPQLADNFERAAELSAVGDEELLATYEALRPMRSTSEELVSLAARMDDIPAPRVAALVREAAAHYERCGLLREPEQP